MLAALIYAAAEVCTMELSRGRGVYILDSKRGWMMALKRVNVHLDQETMPQLRELVKKIQGKDPWGWYSLTASDLVRFAISECYGIGNDRGVHYYDVDELRSRIKRALKR